MTNPQQRQQELEYIRKAIKGPLGVYSIKPHKTIPFLLSEVTRLRSALESIRTMSSHRSDLTIIHGIARSSLDA